MNIKKPMKARLVEVLEAMLFFSPSQEARSTPSALGRVGGKRESGQKRRRHPERREIRKKLAVEEAVVQPFSGY
jgi:hypothetical protein